MGSDAWFRLPYLVSVTFVVEGSLFYAPLYPPIYIPQKQALFDKTCRLSFLNNLSFFTLPVWYEFLNFKTSLPFHIPVNENAESGLILALRGGGALSVGCQSLGGWVFLPEPPARTKYYGGRRGQINLDMVR